MPYSVLLLPQSNLVIFIFGPSKMVQSFYFFYKNFILFLCYTLLFFLFYFLFYLIFFSQHVNIHFLTSMTRQNKISQLRWNGKSTWSMYNNPNRVILLGNILLFCSNKTFFLFERFSFWVILLKLKCFIKQKQHNLYIFFSLH